MPSMFWSWLLVLILNGMRFKEGVDSDGVAIGVELECPIFCERSCWCLLVLRQGWGMWPVVVGMPCRFYGFWFSFDDFWKFVLAMMIGLRFGWPVLQVFHCSWAGIETWDALIRIGSRGQRRVSVLSWRARSVGGLRAGYILLIPRMMSLSASPRTLVKLFLVAVGACATWSFCAWGLCSRFGCLSLS